VERGLLAREAREVGVEARHRVAQGGTGVLATLLIRPASSVVCACFVVLRASCRKARYTSDARTETRGGTGRPTPAHP